MKRPLITALCLLAISALVFSAEPPNAPTPGSNLHRWRLPNGLELYVYRDAAVPLARIQLAFRAGAIAQDRENAGAFHLYEHLLFRGSASKPGSEAVRAELARIGASEWNGGTSAERVSYWLTLPSSRCAAGMSFFADAVTVPLEPGSGFEAEKEIVVKEIEGYAADPDQVYEAALNRRLFAKYPWRRDPAGNAAAVRAATKESLRALQATWFVPNNAALFVGGDVEPEEVRADAERLFGGWKAGADPWARPLPAHPRPGVSRPTWIVFPDPSLPEGVGSFEARYRGPDLGQPSETGASYAADLWTALVAAPGGRFKAELMKNVPKLYGPSSISAAYLAQRDGSWISVSAYFFVDPSLPAADRAELFKERARAFEMTAMKLDPAYFSAEDYAAARKRLLDARALELDTVAGAVDALAFWWASASVDYFAGYPAALETTGQRELAAFLDVYVMRNLEVVAVRMNPADYARERRNFSAALFETVDPGNAFWWAK